MARPGITFEQVAAAASALTAAGKQPSIRALREQLGGTGSPNTIHRHLVTWREANPIAVVASPALPQSLTVAIAAEIERAGAHASAEVQARLAQALAEVADLAAAGELLEAERDALAEQVGALSSERDTLVGKSTQQAADLVAQAQRIEREQQAAEAARVDFARAQLKAEALAEAGLTQTLELDRVRALLEGERTARIAAEQQVAVLAAKLDASTERMTKAEASAELVAKQSQHSAQELSNARVHVQSQQIALDAAAREITAAQEAVKEARAEAKKALEEAAELRGAMAVAQSKKTKKEAKSEVLWKDEWTG